MATSSKSNKIYHHILAVCFTTLFVIFILLFVLVNESNEVKQLMLALDSGNPAAINATTSKSTSSYQVGLELNRKIERFIVDDKNREILLSYLDQHTAQRAISSTILDKSLNWNVPVGLAFGLAWSESRFDPEAINGIHNNNGTRDWGLFQLNDSHRSSWTQEDFFNVEKNTEAAMEYLAMKLRQFDFKPVLAIAAYNAGSTGVRRGVGFSTLVHINNIIDFSNRLEAEINEIIE